MSYNSKKLLSDLELEEIESLEIKDIKSRKLFELIQKTTVPGFEPSKIDDILLNFHTTHSHLANQKHHKYHVTLVNIQS